MSKVVLAIFIAVLIISTIAAIPENINHYPVHYALGSPVVLYSLRVATIFTVIVVLFSIFIKSCFGEYPVEVGMKGVRYKEKADEDVKALVNELKQQLIVDAKQHLETVRNSKDEFASIKARVLKIENQIGAEDDGSPFRVN